jgi:SAM-dependent methyltransferase
MLSLDPDDSAIGFLGYQPNPLRYEHHDNSPYEAHRIISSLLSMDQKVLEVGCGTGILGDELKRKGISHYEGIEPSKERANTAQAKGHKVHNLFLTYENQAGLGKFDVIVLADVIEHLANPQSLLELVKRLMHPSSLLVVSVPNVAHWSIRLKLLRGKFDYAETGILDATHLRWFTRGSLEKYLENSGYRICSYRYTSGYMLPCYSQLRRNARRVLCTDYQRKLLGILAACWPSLFACQMIYSCTIK